MGNVQKLTREQTLVLNELSQNEYVTRQGYFTGGTALSTYYLHHRESEDLDIFSLDPWDGKNVLQILSEIMKREGGTIKARFVDPVNIYMLSFSNGTTLKVDVSQYPYPLLEQSKKKVGNLRIDSLVDIATNKLLSITQRCEVKDYVDLYYLLQTYTFWDLRTGVADKFHVDIDPLLLSSDLLVVDSFTYLPKMYTDLTLEELQRFFHEQAIELGKTMVE